MQDAIPAGPLRADDGVEPHGLRRALPWLGIAALCAGLRAFALDRGLWQDEFVSVQFASESIGTLVRRAADEDTHPPGYYLLLHAWAALLSGDVAARALSILVGVGHVLLIGAVAARLAGRRVGLMAAALAATSPEVARAAWEIRSYALHGALATLAWYAAVRLLDDGRVRWAALLAAALSAGLYVFYYAVIPYVGLTAFFLAMRPSRRVALLALASCAAAALAFLPQLPTFLAQSRLVRELTPAGSFQFDARPSWLLDAWLLRHVVTLGPWGSLLFAVGAPIALLAHRLRWPGMREDPSAPRPRPSGGPSLRSAVVLCAALVVAVLAMAIAGSFVHRRYAVFLAGAYCVLSALLLLRLPPRLSRSLFLLLLLGGAAQSVYLARAPDHAAWREAVTEIASHSRSDEVVLLFRESEDSWHHYGSSSSAPSLLLGVSSEPDRARVRPTPSVSSRLSSLSSDLLGRHGAWLLTGASEPPSSTPLGELRSLLSSLAWSRSSRSVFHRIAVEHWLPP